MEAYASDGATPERIEIDIDAPPFDERGAASGEAIDRRFTVDCLAAECYLRVRAEALVEVNGLEGSASDFSYSAPVEPGWMLGADGWFYLTRPFAPGERVGFTTALDASAAISAFKGMRQGDRARLVETGYAEAIQAKDTVPDFSSGLPWEGAYKGPGEPGMGSDASGSKGDPGSLYVTGDGFGPASLICFALALAFLALTIVLARIAFWPRKRAGEGNDAQRESGSKRRDP